MGEHTTESNSLSGKSLPHVDELSSSLGASKFCPLSLQPCVDSMWIRWLRKIFGLAMFSSCWSFSHEKQWLASVFIPCVCDGCALSFKSNPTWLSFISDDIRVCVKGWGLGVCTSEFLAKPPNPGDGVRRITVSASLGGGVTVCLQDLNLV